MRILIVALACLSPANVAAQDIMIRRVVKPPPVNLSELIAVPGPAPQGICPFEPANLETSDSARLMLGDTAALDLPMGWQRRPPHELDAGFDAVRLGAPDGSRIRIERERNGARGRSFTMYRSGEVPTGESCVLDLGEVGAIWTFYEPDPGVDDNPLPFLAFADILTPARRWYRISINSESAEQRLQTARVVTAIFFGQVE